MNAMVTLRRDGHVAELTFANPPHNHVNVALLRELADALEALDAAPDCRAVVLASAGKAFCAGADLASADGIGSGTDPLRRFYDQAERLFATAKPIVVAVQGAAIGAGLGLAVAADFRVASVDARFSGNFTRLGFHPGFGLTHTLPRLIGAQRAALMLLTSRRFKPEDICEWGLVDQIVPAADLSEAAWTLAREIADNAPLALTATRKSLRGDLAAQVKAALLREHAEQLALQKTADYAEGVSAVFARRAPQFIGK